MAARALSSEILLLLLFVCSAFSYSSLSFTIEKLLNIKQHTPDNIFPVFDYYYYFVVQSSQRCSIAAQTRMQTEKREACWRAG